VEPDECGRFGRVPHRMRDLSCQPVSHRRLADRIEVCPKNVRGLPPHHNLITFLFWPSPRGIAFIGQRNKSRFSYPHCSTARTRNSTSLVVISDANTSVIHVPLPLLRPRRVKPGDHTSLSSLTFFRAMFSVNRDRNGHDTLLIPRASLLCVLQMDRSRVLQCARAWTRHKQIVYVNGVVGWSLGRLRTLGIETDVNLQSAKAISQFSTGSSAISPCLGPV